MLIQCNDKRNYIRIFYQRDIFMGQQYCRSESASQMQTVNSNRMRESRAWKTNFFYIHPLQCQAEDLQPHQQEFLQIDFKKHQEQYQIIENNNQDIPVNSIKDLQKIQEIKVKWNQFIKMKKRNYLEDYSVLKEIGRGGFGCVHKVKGRYTGLYRAAKRIKKAQLKKSQHQKLLQQMAIMISLDHPNVAKLYQVYDYKSYYVLILQLCEGGELFKKIVTKQLNEQLAGRIMKQILRTLIYLHSVGIVHRDLKPENMLFEQNSDIIKIIDFGIAVKKKPEQILTARLGTPYYIAPEVLGKNYGQKCDIWSAGVILYMMVSGYPPFRGQSEFQVMQNILKQNVSFKGPVWNKITSDCKNLISLMLKRSPDERPSAKQAFQHHWIKKFSQKPTATSKSNRQDNILANIRGFSFQNKLQAVVYTYIVSQLLTSDEKKIFVELFKELDKNHDGVIQTQELREALKMKKDISEQRVKFLVRIIDTNGSGLIDYTEFLVAGIDAKNQLTEQHFEQAFQYFDIDHSGEITFEEIAHFLEDTKQSYESIKKIFQQVDENNDGTISKNEFVKLLFQQTKKKLEGSLRQIGEKEQSKQDVSKKVKDNKSGYLNPNAVNQGQSNPSAVKKSAGIMKKSVNFKNQNQSNKQNIK